MYTGVAFLLSVHWQTGIPMFSQDYLLFYVNTFLGCKPSRGGKLMSQVQLSLGTANITVLVANDRKRAYMELSL